MIALENTSLPGYLGWSLLALAPLFAWLVGGIPWGVLLIRWIRGVDLRQIGSGNIGATNAARAMGGGKTGLALFLAVYLLDLGKAPAAILPGLALAPTAPEMTWLPDLLLVLTGAAVIMGHCFSPWLGFRGGKGVATTCGVLLMLNWLLLPLGLGVFFFFFLIFRMVSLGSICMGLALPIIWLCLEPEPFSGRGLTCLVFLFTLTLLILLRHRTNLGRIISGGEPRVKIWGKGKGQGRSG